MINSQWDLNKNVYERPYPEERCSHIDDKKDIRSDNSDC